MRNYNVGHEHAGHRASHHGGAGLGDYLQNKASQGKQYLTSSRLAQYLSNLRNRKSPKPLPQAQYASYEQDAGKKKKRRSYSKKSKKHRKSKKSKKRSHTTSKKRSSHTKSKKRSVKKISHLTHVYARKTSRSRWQLAKKDSKLARTGETMALKKK